MDEDKEKDLGRYQEIEESASNHRRKSKKDDSHDSIYYMPIGLALGTVFGDMIFGNMVTGMIIGMLFGLSLGTVLDLLKKKS